MKGAKDDAALVPILLFNYAVAMHRYALDPVQAATLSSKARIAALKGVKRLYECAYSNCLHFFDSVLNWERVFLPIVVITMDNLVKTELSGCAGGSDRR